MMSLTELGPAVWSEKQFGTCELGDERRTRRLVRYAQQMAEKPDASTPKQTESWSDCKAVDRLEAVIGVTCVEAVRLLQLRDVARNAPETPAKKLVPGEWIEVLGKIKRHTPYITTVRDFMRTMASLGGFLGRKSDGEPGWQTLWRGLETLLTAVRGYRFALRKCG
jgi:hypothetical protein